jgi:hypothetical protein
VFLSIWLLDACKQFLYSAKNNLREFCVSLIGSGLTHIYKWSMPLLFGNHLKHQAITTDTTELNNRTMINSKMYPKPLATIYKMTRCLNPEDHNQQ